MDEKQMQALSDFCDGIDAMVTKLRHELGIATQTAPRTPAKAIDFNKIKWKSMKGDRGNYLEAAFDDENTSNEDYQNLKNALIAKGEKKSATMTVGDKGLMFIWLFPDGEAVGMKPAPWGRK